MSEAEVAQQLIADLQANIGVISGFIIILLIGGLIALGTTLSNASRAMRELQEGARSSGKQSSGGLQMAYAVESSKRRLPAPTQQAASSRPVSRELKLARKSAPRHQAVTRSSFQTYAPTPRRPRRLGDRHSVI